MIIGLAGFAGSGKDTVAQILVKDWNYTRYAFADLIKKVLYETNPIVEQSVRLKDLVDEYGWDKTKNDYLEVRRLLQDFGLAGRNNFGKLHWASQIFKQIGFSSKAVITDVRFWNEADQIKMFDFAQVWRVHRPGTGPVNNHESELELVEYLYDAVIINDSDINSLKEKVDVEITKAFKKISKDMTVDGFKNF